MFYQKKKLLEKAATIKRFEYSSLGKELKAQTDIAKYQNNFLDDQKNNFIDENVDEGEEDYTEEDESGESNITIEFDAIQKDIKNKGGGATKSVSVKSHGANINLHPLIIKSLNAEKAKLQKCYGFHEALSFFDEIDNKRNKLTEYKPRNCN